MIQIQSSGKEASNSDKEELAQALQLNSVYRQVTA